MANTSTKIAESPFDDVAGDTILRSSGEKPVDFCTYKLFLIHASPVFKDMFTPPKGRPPMQQHPGPLVVTMREGADDLRTLLIWCHPAIVPDRPTTLERFHRFYGIADKYMLDRVKVWLRQCLTEFVKQMPVGVYVLARHLDWKEEAKLAAEESLSRELYQLVTESHTFLRTVPAQFLQDLLQYHFRTSTFLSSQMDPSSQIFKWTADPNAGVSFLAEKEDCCPTVEHYFERDHSLYSRAWWATFASDCSASLAKIPNFEKIPLKEITSKAVTTAKKCPGCGPLAQSRLESFFVEVKRDLLYMRRNSVCYSRCFTFTCSRDLLPRCSIAFLWINEVFNIALS